MRRKIPRVSTGTITTIFGVAAVLGGTIAWQRSTDSQQKVIDAQTESTYVSPLGEFQFTAPVTWTVGEDSVEEDGIVRIDLNGPRNSNVNKAYAEAIGDDTATVEDAFLQAEYDKLLDSSLGNEFALLQIEVVSATAYELPESKEQWKAEFESTPSVAQGIAFGEFEDFSVEGAEGYKYNVTLFEGERTVEATNYYLLGDLAEAEILLFPASSGFAQEAEEIIKSFLFVKSEDIEQFLEDQLDESNTSGSDETE